MHGRNLGWVYQHSTALIIPYLDAETRFPAVAEMLRNRGVGRLGVLLDRRVTPGAFGASLLQLEADAQQGRSGFLSLVANQVAAGGDERVELRHSAACHGALARKRRGCR